MELKRRKQVILLIPVYKAFFKYCFSHYIKKKTPCNGCTIKRKNAKNVHAYFIYLKT